MTSSSCFDVFRRSRQAGNNPSPAAPNMHEANAPRRRKGELVRLMTVPAHGVASTPRALPAVRMRIAAISPHLVASNAIRGGTLLVAACTRDDVAPRVLPVEIATLHVGAHPTGRVRVLSIQRVAADPPFDVATVAIALGMTTQTLGWCGGGLDRVARDEISAVHHALLDALGKAPLDGDLPADIVASLALRLSMAGLTQDSIGKRCVSVTAQETFVVPQKRRGEGVLEVASLVTGAALSTIELLFVLVTAEALAHGRDCRLAFTHHTGMATDALALDPFHGEMLVVVEGDLTVRAGRDHVEHVGNLLEIVAVAARTQAGIRQLVGAFTLARRMAGVAGEAVLLPGPATTKAGQMLHVREASFAFLAARCQDGRNRDRRDQKPERPACVHHDALRTGAENT